MKCEICGIAVKVDRLTYYTFTIYKLTCLNTHCGHIKRWRIPKKKEKKDEKMVQNTGNAGKEKI